MTITNDGDQWHVRDQFDCILFVASNFPDALAALSRLARMSGGNVITVVPMGMPPQKLQI